MGERTENALQQLYEDSNLRDELTDEESQPLFKWAESKLGQLDASNADDAAFEEAVDGLRGLMKAVNRYVGQRAYATPEEQAASLARIAEYAPAIGSLFAPDQAQPVIAAQGAEDNVAVLSALLAQIDGAAAPVEAQSVQAEQPAQTVPAVAPAPALPEPEPPTSQPVDTPPVDENPVEQAPALPAEASPAPETPVEETPLQQFGQWLWSRTHVADSDAETSTPDKTPASPIDPASHKHEPASGDVP